jgi:hypothetical protein
VNIVDGILNFYFLLFLLLAIGIKLQRNEKLALK